MKRSLSLLVALILIVGLFASCGTTGKAAAAGGDAAVDQNAATGLYYTCKDLEGKVPEDKKTKEPWTKGVQIFAMGEQLYQKGMYTESLPALGQAKKFWSGLVDEKTAPVVANDEYNAKGLYYTGLDLREKVPEDKKSKEPWTKGVQIFAMGEQLYQRGMYSDSIPALKQAVKFWSGLIE